MVKFSFVLHSFSNRLESLMKVEKISQRLLAHIKTV